MKESVPNLNLISQPNDQTLEGSFSSVSTPNFAVRESYRAPPSPTPPHPPSPQCAPPNGHPPMGNYNVAIDESRFCIPKIIKPESERSDKCRYNTVTSQCTPTADCRRYGPKGSGKRKTHLKWHCPLTRKWQISTRKSARHTVGSLPSACTDS